eukprot:TRINITY_DN5356_c0_g1_i1.p1 TRINITY_DN5356_c0_g1~~TRINITY_DN5356_c0_g1_i1.p1  ORF type:complete len:566 (-),score=75.93 TRINITY_DN5356_c0_g1_i1:45-1715(-)
MKLPLSSVSISSSPSPTSVLTSTPKSTPPSTPTSVAPIAVEPTPLGFNEPSSHTENFFSNMFGAKKPKSISTLAVSSERSSGDLTAIVSSSPAPISTTMNQHPSSSSLSFQPGVLTKQPQPTTPYTLRSASVQLPTSTEPEDQFANMNITLDDLIKLITSEKLIDKNLKSYFLMTYRSFTTPLELFFKLRDRFVQSLKSHNKKQQVVQFRVLSFLNTWITTNKYDFDDSSLRNSIQEFISAYLNPSLPTTANLKTALNCTITSKPDDRLKSKTETKAPSKLLEEFDVKKLAEQFSLTIWMAYRNISPREFITKSWLHASRSSRAPNIIECLEITRKFADWLAVQILVHSNIQTRANMINKILELGKELLNTRNFQGLHALAVTFNSPAVKRLKHTWALIQKTEESLLEIVQGFTPSSKFSEYRRLCKSTTEPFIPCLVAHLSDIEAVEDSMPTFVGGSNQINFSKFSKIAKAVLEVLKEQKSSHQVPKIEFDIYEFLSSLPFVEEEEMMKLSMKNEPTTSSFLGTQRIDTVQSNSQSHTIPARSKTVDVLSSRKGY